MKIKFYGKIGSIDRCHVSTWDDVSHPPRIGDEIELSFKNPRNANQPDMVKVTRVVWRERRPPAERKKDFCDVEISVRYPTEFYVT